MPTESGGRILSIAVSRRSGNLFVAGYTVILLYIFSLIWELILYLVVAFFPSMDCPNRHVLMVGFWNSGDPMTATAFMVEYTWKAFVYMKTEAGGRDWRTFGWSCLLLSAAMCGAGGGIAAGILVPTAMDVGKVAPARASEVFFARPPLEMTASERLKSQALRAPAALRAIGRVEASHVTLNERVKVNIEGGGGDTIKYSYSYYISGWDLGLQNYPGFRQTVEGECATEYSWLNSGAAKVDEYFPWGNQSEIVIVQKTAEEKDPPRAEIRIHPNYLYDTVNSSRVLFAIIPHTAGRHSFTPSSDPWYKTVPSGATSIDDAGYKVDTGRPALSCWQQTSYRYGGETVNSAFHLKNLTGFNIPQAWDNHFRTEFGLPKIIDLGTSLGRSILLSSATYLNENFEAESSTIGDDIERLVLGSFVASRDTFRDSTMVKGGDRLPNAAIGSDGRPQPGVGDFTLPTGNVITLRFDILVSMPALAAGLWLISKLIHLTFTRGAIESDFHARSAALQATQLYRFMDDHAPVIIDEKVPAGISYPSTKRAWEGREARVPYIRNPEASDPASPGGLGVVKPQIEKVTRVDPNALTEKEEPVLVRAPTQLLRRGQTMPTLVRAPLQSLGRGQTNPTLARASTQPLGRGLTNPALVRAPSRPLIPGQANPGQANPAPARAPPQSLGRGQANPALFRTSTRSLGRELTDTVTRIPE